MTREIVFRGKRTDTGEWVYGYYYSECGNTYIIENRQKEDMAKRNIPFRVKADTIGQYTGLRDRKGKEIFEGDILSVYDRQGHFNIIVKWDKEAMAFLACYCSGDQSPLSWFSPLLSETYKIKVIGNIHDNLELLEGEK